MTQKRFLHAHSLKLAKKNETFKIYVKIAVWPHILFTAAIVAMCLAELEPPMQFINFTLHGFPHIIWSKSLAFSAWFFNVHVSRFDWKFQGW